MTEQNQIRLVEVRFLKRGWWLFPVVGCLLAMAAARWGWYLVSLNPEDINYDWGRGFHGRYLLIVLAFPAMPLVWWLGLAASGRWPWLNRSAGINLIIPVLVLAAAEMMMRMFMVQLPFWLAVRSRNDTDSDFFGRELASLRLQVLHDRPGPRPGLVVAGTSQMIWGVDYELLQRLLPEYQVKRRAIAAMIPMRICVAQQYLSLQEGDTLALYLSEYDMTTFADLDVSWMRPLSSVYGVTDFVAIMPAGMRARYWRKLIDLGLACVSEIWRTRDYLRQTVFRTLGSGERKVSANIEDVLSSQRAAFLSAVGESPFYQLNFDALAKIVKRVQAKSGRVIIFEGRINPLMETAETRRMHADTRQRLNTMARIMAFDYIPEAEQSVAFESADWRDGTHLNPAGREKWTRYMAEVLGGRLHEQQHKRSAD